MGYDSVEDRIKILDDPEFVKIVIRLFSYSDDLEADSEELIPYHKCTQADYDKFYQIESGKENQYNLLVDLIGFYCLDWNSEDPYLLFGS